MKPRDPVKLLKAKGIKQTGCTLTNYEVAHLLAWMTNQSNTRIAAETRALTLQAKLDRAINKESEDAD